MLFLKIAANHSVKQSNLYSKFLRNMLIKISISLTIYITIILVYNLLLKFYIKIRNIKTYII